MVAYPGRGAQGRLNNLKQKKHLKKVAILNIVKKAWGAQMHDFLDVACGGWRSPLGYYFPWSLTTDS